MRIQYEKECDHAYFLYDGENISLSDFYDLELKSGVGRINERDEIEWIHPFLSHIIDRRRNYAEHYTFCPYCGIKLNWKDVKEACYAYEEASNSR